MEGRRTGFCEEIVMLVTHEVSSADTHDTTKLFVPLQEMKTLL